MSEGEIKSWYSTSYVAKILGRSDRFVRDRVKSGEIDANEHKGQRRTSYKISAEALASYMIASQRKIPSEIEPLLKDIPKDYLYRLDQAIVRQLNIRGEGRVEIVPKCRAMLKPVVNLESLRLPSEFVYEDWAVYERYYNNPLMLCSTALNIAQKSVEGHLSIEITTVEFFEQLRKGEASDDYQPPWEPGHTPIIYVDCLMLEDPFWAPFIFRHMAGQILEFERHNRVCIESAFAVAAAGESFDLLKRYGFVEVDRLKGQYPIMLCKELRKNRLGRFLRA